MDLSANSQRRLTPEERQDRMKRGVCIVCNTAGHFKANCPKATRSIGQVAATVEPDESVKEAT